MGEEWVNGYYSHVPLRIHLRVFPMCPDKGQSFLEASGRNICMLHLSQACEVVAPAWDVGEQTG